MSYRPARLLTALLSAGLMGGGIAHAQTPFQSMFVFGGSFADIGMSTCIVNYGAANCEYPRHNLLPRPPGVAESGYIVPYPIMLQQFYGIPDANVFNYAVSGSTTYSGRDGYSMTYAVDTFLASGRRIAPTDVVVISGLANDQNANKDGTPIATIRASAAAEAAATANLMKRLMGAGARTFSFLDPGNFALSNQGGANNFSQYAPLSTMYSMQELLPLARAGARIFYMQDGILFQRLIDNPQAYGFATKADAYLPTNGRHLNPAGMTVLARYIQNQMDSPTIVAPQGQIVTSMADSFSQSVFSNLDAYRNFGGYGWRDSMAAMPTRAKPVPFADYQRWHAYAQLSYAGASLDKQFYSADGSLSAVGGLGGLEYRVNPNWKIGVALTGSAPNVHLSTQNARIDNTAFLIGGYSSYTMQNWFSDALIAYGHQRLDLSRDGVMIGSSILGSTTANTFTAAFRSGYLFDLGLVKAGPIGGLNYTHASIGSYTEHGDILIAQNVASQKIDKLTGNLGVQFRMPIAYGPGHLINSYVNLTAEHQFLDGTRNLETSIVSAAILPIFTPVADYYKGTYGKVEAGISGDITGSIKGTISGYSTFARSSGEAYGVNAGIKVAF